MLANLAVYLIIAIMVGLILFVIGFFIWGMFIGKPFTNHPDCIKKYLE